MYSANVIALGKAALTGTETEQRITVLLYDDNYQVISSFELNQIASLTYHEGSMVGAIDINDKLLDSLLTIMSKPIDYSPLTIEKSLVVTKHILVFGCSKIIHPIRVTLGRFIEELQSYNTALIAQQQTGATGILMRLKGGSVDKGGPVRDIATIVFRYIQNDTVLQFERNTQADPNSLVPIGERTKVSYVSDDARLRYLKRKMDHQKLLEQKSNLAKASDGFGAGYMSRDGKSVVGAAHGIDEMIRQAQKSKKQFVDDNDTARQHHDDDINVDELRQYAQEFEQQYGYTGSHQQNRSRQQQQQQPQQQHAEVPDLLSLNDLPSSAPQSYNTHQQPPDLLLDFGPPQSQSAPSYGAAQSTGSLLDSDFYTSVSTPSTTDPNAQFGTLPTTTSYPTAAVNDPFMPPSTVVGTSEQQPQPIAIKKNIMGGGGSSSFGGGLSDDDPFAVLGGSTTTTSSLTNNAMSMSGGLTSSFAGLGLGGGHTSSGSYGGNNNTNNNINIGKDSFGSLGVLGSVAPITTTPNMNSNFTTNNMGSMYGGNGVTSLSGSFMQPNSMSSSLSEGYGGLSNNNNNNMMMNNGIATMLPVTSTSPVNLSSIQVSQSGYTPSDVVVDDDDLASGFVMGGTTGSGLIPLGAAPDVPPPPPPSSSEW